MNRKEYVFNRWTTIEANLVCKNSVVLTLTQRSFITVRLMKNKLIIKVYYRKKIIKSRYCHQKNKAGDHFGKWRR